MYFFFNITNFVKFNSNIKENVMYFKVFRSHSAYKSYNGPPCVGIQSVADHQFRIEFPSTGKKRDPSIPGARIYWTCAVPSNIFLDKGRGQKNAKRVYLLSSVLNKGLINLSLFLIPVNILNPSSINNSLQTCMSTSFVVLEFQVYILVMFRLSEVIDRKSCWLWWSILNINNRSSDVCTKHAVSSIHYY